MVRITGWVLLVVGFLLCVSVSWAALGFLLMGVGLVSLQVARPTHEQEPAIVATAAMPSSPPPLAPPALPPEPAPQFAEVFVAASAADAAYDGASYDKEAWKRLLAEHSDLAQVASIMEEYGPAHVEELARACLAASNANQLPAIVDGVIRKVRRNADRRAARSLQTERPQPAVTAAPIVASDRTEPRFQQRTLHPPAPALPREPRPEAPATAAPPVVVPVVEPAPPADARGNTITSADDDLTAMIGLFAPDSNSRRKTI